MILRRRRLDEVGAAPRVAQVLVVFVIESRAGSFFRCLTMMLMLMAQALCRREAPQRRCCIKSEWVFLTAERSMHGRLGFLCICGFWTFGVSVR